MASLLLLMPVIGRALASLDSAGSLALYTYAQKLVELPLGAAITVLALIAFPGMSRNFSDPTQRSKGTRLLVTTIQMTLILSVGIALPCVVFARQDCRSRVRTCRHGARSGDGLGVGRASWIRLAAPTRHSDCHASRAQCRQGYARSIMGGNNCCRCPIPHCGCRRGACRWSYGVDGAICTRHIRSARGRAGGKNRPSPAGANLAAGA